MSSKYRKFEDGEVKCPMSLDDVDLFAPGAQEYWYEAYDILHQESPVHRIPGEGYAPGTDGFILTKYEDIARVVRDPVRFPPSLSLGLQDMAAAKERGETPPFMNAMMESMLTLRPNIDRSMGWPRRRSPSGHDPRCRPRND